MIDFVFGPFVEFSFMRPALDNQHGAAVDAIAERFGATETTSGKRAMRLTAPTGMAAATAVFQALRGAGPTGLAAMPRQVSREGLCWARPWLTQPRASIETYLSHHGLRWVEDPSNGDTRFDIADFGPITDRNGNGDRHTAFAC